MRLPACTLTLALILLALTPLTAAAPAQRTEILLKPVDSGYIVRLEHVPRPKYIHRSMTASEVARELILERLYGKPLDEALLSFLLRCRRDGYFSKTPSDTGFDAESTFYAAWLLSMLGMDPGVNASLLEERLCSAEEFGEAYYIVRTLMLLHYNVTGCLDDWDLGYAVSWIRSSDTPSIEATRLWLLVWHSPEKEKWLEERGGASGSEWYNIEALILSRPVYINVSVYPRIVVDEEPRLVYCNAVRWPSQRLECRFTWRVENDTIVSLIAAGGRRLVLKHILARKEYAMLKITQRTGQIVVTTSYKPPYNLTLIIAGKKYTWRCEGYDLNTTIDLPAYGVLKVSAEIEAKDAILQGKGEIRLETSPERSLLDIAFVALPLAAIAPSLASSRRRRRLGFSMLWLLLAAPIPLSWNLLLEIHPLWLTLGYGLAVLASVYLLDREAFWRAAGHVLVVVLLASASMLLGNPLVIVLGGVGAALFLAAAILYPSELSKTEKMYRSSMTLYALGMLVMGAVVEASASIASLLWAPDSGFISSVEVQAMFMADLFALTPVLAGVWHLARLIHSYERAREAREILERLAPV